MIVESRALNAKREAEKKARGPVYINLSTPIKKDVKKDVKKEIKEEIKKEIK
jgi:hypothetical protein